MVRRYNHAAAMLLCRAGQKVVPTAAATASADNGARSMSGKFSGRAMLVIAAMIASALRLFADEPKSAAEPIPDGLVKLFPKSDVWLDKQRKAVVVDGQVCLREGQLEMFACPRGTKEHESIVALNCQAQDVHAGLLAAGAKPGRPVSFDPEYKPAAGQIVDIYVLWKDEEGNKHQARAQEWIKDIKAQKAM